MLIDIALLLVALPVLVLATYLFTLAAFSIQPPVSQYRLPPRLRFDVVVPAHNEESGISETVRSLLSLDYPETLRRVMVVADNCTDSTAQRASEAGATVLVRSDQARRGKGYALAYAFERSLAEGTADAIVVVDADTSVSPNLLLAFAHRLEAGARAAQSDNGVRNPQASWRTRLLFLAFTLFIRTRSLGRERLGCSVGLRGNGMCFAASVLREIPHQAFSVVEDLEYGIRLGQAGYRVHYAGEARVLSDMVVGADASRVQRQRWEGGRFQMARQHTLPLLRSAIAKRDRVLFDLGLDLAVPPLAYLAAAAALGTVVSALISLSVGYPLVALWVWGASLTALCGYVARGWYLSKTGLRGLMALLYAPVYLFWKLGLVLGRRKPSNKSWARTPRERRP